MEFFLWSLHWKCGRRRGERGFLQDFNYMGYRLIKIVESNHFQNKWHSWALIH
jgi:hypothetical protein